MEERVGEEGTACVWVWGSLGRAVNWDKSSLHSTIFLWVIYEFMKWIQTQLHSLGPDTQDSSGKSICIGWQGTGWMCLAPHIYDTYVAEAISCSGGGGGDCTVCSVCVCVWARDQSRSCIHDNWSLTLKPLVHSFHHSVFPSFFSYCLPNRHTSYLHDCPVPSHTHLQE